MLKDELFVEIAAGHIQKLTHVLTVEQILPVVATPLAKTVL